MKKIKKICALIITLSMALNFSTVSVLAAPKAEERVVYTFSNEEILKLVETSYDNNEILKEEYDIIKNALVARLGVKGENKIVQVSSDTYDYYLNNVVWGIITGAAGGAAGAILGALPGLAPGVIAIIAGAAGGAASTLLGAEKGVIIRIRMIDISGGIGAPRYAYQYIGIREQ